MFKEYLTFNHKILIITFNFNYQMIPDSSTFAARYFNTIEVFCGNLFRYFSTIVNGSSTISTTMSNQNSAMLHEITPNSSAFSMICSMQSTLYKKKLFIVNRVLIFQYQSTPIEGLSTIFKKAPQT